MKKLMTALFLIVSLIIALAGPVNAQAPDTVWSHIYTAKSAALSLYEMPDSGFVLGGYIVPEGESYRDFFIIRTDANGDTVWTREIGDDGRQESADCLRPTADGGFIMTGNRGQDSPYSPYADVYLVKIDKDGVGEWGSIFGTSIEGESAVSVAQMSDRGFIVAGDYWNSSTVYDTWLIGTDSLGLMVWDDQYTWPDADYPTCMNLTDDGGFVITGYTQSFDTDYDYDMFILKLDALGTEQWSDAYGTSHPIDEQASYICQTSDGGYLMCGSREEYGVVPKDIYVIKTNASQGVEWSSQLGGTYHDAGRACIETIDGGYAVAASWHRNGNWQTALIKYDSLGDTSWTAFWGDSTSSCIPYGLVQTADNGYVVAGTMSGGTNASFMVKFEAEPGYESYTFHSDGLTVPIDENALASDTILVSLGGDRIVTGVRAVIDTLEHPALDELTMTIMHNGTEITLVGEGDIADTNLFCTNFADASIMFLGGSMAPYTGTYRPIEHLGDFNGMDPDGYWILNVNDGTSGNDGTLKGWGITLLIDITLGVDNAGSKGLLPGYSLGQCYPNPFNPETIISYSLPRKSDVSLEVYNILGQKVTTLIDESKPAGDHQVSWDGTDYAGDEVSAGIYFYRLQAGDFSETKKMVLMK